MLKVIVKDIGRKGYADAVQYQEELFNSIQVESNIEIEIAGYLIFCEHPHVITLGKSGKTDNLLLNNEQLKKFGIEYFKTSRGGDITYHGPGQIVCYPIVNIQKLGLGVKKYMHLLEEVVIKTLEDYQIHSGRINNMTGVWLDTDIPARSRKICAMGVKISHWVTMHGFALNVNTELSYFNYIVPCGITGKAVTSIEKELHEKVDMEDCKSKIKGHFSEIFQVEIRG